MASTDNNDPITLANVDDYLHHQDLFLPHHDGPTPHEIDAAITNASNSLLEEHDSSSLERPRRHNDLDFEQHHGHDDDGNVIDPSLMESLTQDDSDNAQASSSQSQNTRSHLVPYKRRILSEDAVQNPSTNLAPFIKPQRSEDSPHPEQIYFTSRDDFEEWLKGESSWCHYVQRRITNPEKRADERLKARIRAHERALAEMDPDQQASAPALKRRRRNRTSAVKEKVTYTCHHAGTYSSKHSADLPQAKLRMNTKQSVKCSCSSRIVLTEVENGDCSVMYYWKHEGHDPFASAELEAGRLPKVVDDWLNRQILQGFTVDQIRAKLELSPEAKEEYIRKATEDPSFVTADMPPALALSVKVKYPDIYNRFRKMRGPVKDSKVSRETRAFRIKKTDGETTPVDSPSAGNDNGNNDNSLFSHLYDEAKDGQGHLQGMGDLKQGDTDGEAHLSSDQGLDPHVGAGPSISRDHNNGDNDQDRGQNENRKHDDDDHLDHRILADSDEPSMLHTEDVDHQFDEHLARLASDGQLAEALLRLPQGSTDEGQTGHHQNLHQAIGVGVGVGVGASSGSGSGAVGEGEGGEGGNPNSNSNLEMGQDDEVEENLREAVFRMARAERADWASMVQE